MEQQEIDSKKDFNEKVRYIITSLKAPKDNVNSFGKYKYRSCEDILEAVKPILRETKLSLNITDEVIVCGNQVVWVSETETVVIDRVYVKSTAVLSDGIYSVSSVGLAREANDKKGMDDAQITGAASSYARKYALNGLFCIDDTKDADVTNTHGKEVDLMKSGKDTKWLTLNTRDMIESLRDEYNINPQAFKDRIHNLYNTSIDGLTEEEGIDLIKKMKEKFNA